MIMGVKDLKPYHQGRFTTALHEYKDRYDSAIVTLNAVTPDMVKAIAVWPNVAIRVNHAEESGNPWDWVRFSPTAWQCLSSVPVCIWVDVMAAVLNNHLVFPDGTLPGYVAEFLTGRAREMLGA